MATKSGFFNSLNHDRRYNATAFGKCFEGIIRSGVLATVGGAFAVTAAEGLTVNVASGKAWYLNTWLENDAFLPVTLSQSDVVLNRIDAIVLEFNTNENVRHNDIIVVQGTPASNPVRPSLIKTDLVVQIPLAYILVKANATSITQAEITTVIGTDDCPFATGVLETVSLDTLLGQWRSELDNFTEAEKTDFIQWFDQMKADLTREKEVFDAWKASGQDDFNTWFAGIKDKLGSDVAGALQNAIDSETIQRILLSGFVDGVKKFSDDGTVITATASDGRTITKTFTDGFLTVTTVLRSSNGIVQATMIKRFDSSGKTIEQSVSYA